jgi:hypothetical protein
MHCTGHIPVYAVRKEGNRYTFISVFLYFIYLNFRAGGMGLDACLCFFLRINDVRRRKEKILRLGLRRKVTKEIPNVPPILFDNREIIAIDVTNKGNTYVYPKLNISLVKTTFKVEVE